MTSRRPVARSRDEAAWRRLGLIPGAPECVIKVAHRHFIEIHHPDRGGDVAEARRVNTAYDELRGRGGAANEYVAANFTGEAWHVLGLAANADAALVERAGRALKSELAAHSRLAQKVAWAVRHFGEPARGFAPRVPPPSQPRTASRDAARKPRAAAGTPTGLMSRIDLGRLEWGSDLSRDMRLTWTEYAPYKIDVEAPAPLATHVKASKALPGRFIVTFSIDWSSPEFSDNPRIHGYVLDMHATVRWPGGEAPVRVTADLRHPAVVTPTPARLDLGAVTLGDHVRASLFLISTAPTVVDVSCSAWLARTGGDGRVLDAPLRLDANTAVRLTFDVIWAPIIERSRDLPPAKPVRPTGRVTVKWEHGAIDVPVEIVATPRPGARAARRGS
jgi:hypothetical protein